MTCIVGLADGGAVYLGADSGQFTGWDLTTLRDGKIYRKAHTLIGSAGLSRFGQIVRYHLELPSMEGDAKEWLVRLVVPEMRKALKEHGHAKVENGREEHDGRLLVGVAGRLFQVANDCCVSERSDPWDAVGCGADFALGSLHATAGIGLVPRDRIQRALEAAAHFSAGVRAPFTLLTLEPAA